MKLLKEFCNFNTSSLTNLKCMRLIQLIVLFCLSSFLFGQEYDDYIGAGHFEGITVSASDTYQGTNPVNTINGSGLDGAKMEAARFLGQATFGATPVAVDSLVASDLNFESWIDNQFEAEQSQYLSKMNNIWAEITNGMVSVGCDTMDAFGPFSVHFQYAWFDNMMDGEDQLRQRVAFALSQLLVISSVTDLGGYGEALSSYYDLLMDHSFGNYRDLLYDVSLSVPMGYYLSHLNNPKADPDNNIHPDENFAREIMQLFSIGIYELNVDGTRKVDGNGNWIPTYDYIDIKEMAKVFTGLAPGAASKDEGCDWVNEPYFGLGIYCADFSQPMTMFEDWHETSEKIIFDGALSIPANQNGMEDIDMVIEFLFNHPNVGPFVAERMIKRLVKSNPSSGYIERVATIFNNDGNGVRGDMKAMVKAILLDPEARTCEALSEPTNGRLREPVLRLTQFLKAFELTNETGNYWHNGYDLNEYMFQSPLMSPSVFNYYQPDNLLAGVEDNIEAPEFQILNTITLPGYTNMVYAWTTWNSVLNDWEGVCDDGSENYEDWPEYIEDTRTRLNTDWVASQVENDKHEDFVNQMDIFLTYGQLSEEMREIITNAAKGLAPWNNNEYEAYLMIYLLMISPDFAITK